MHQQYNRLPSSALNKYILRHFLRIFHNSFFNRGTYSPQSSLGKATSHSLFQISDLIENNMVDIAHTSYGLDIGKSGSQV